MGTTAVAVCTECDDALPVVVSSRGAVEPIRTGESCMCGAEKFRLVDPSDDGDTSHGESDPSEDVRVT